MTGVTSALVSELESAADNGTSERRVQMLRKVTDLFLSEAARLTERQIGVFDDVLVRLMERIEAQALAEFSVTISDSAVAPRGVIRQLANHEDGSIAAPALSKSDRLSEGDLIEIAGSRGQQHLLAISGRKNICAAVTDVLLERGDYGVSHALARNVGARFSDFGYAALIDRSGRNDVLAEETGLRPDIPAKALRQLLMNASEAVRSRLLKAARPEMRNRIQTSLQQIAEQVVVAAPKRIDYTAAQKTIDLLNRTGKLNDSALSRFAIQGEYPAIVAALSRLSAVPIETVESLVLGGDSDGLIVACRAARLDWSTALSIINNRPGCLPVSQQKLDQGKEIFDGLSLSTAQQTIRIWSTRGAAKKADAPSARMRAR
jgi:uncharacterized protein (DUF2336 family)